MRFLLLVLVVALAVTDVSGGWFRNAWSRAKRAVRDVWRENKGRILKQVLSGRSIDDVDQNGDGVLTRSELEQHMDERDVDDLMDALDENGNDHVTRDVLERYAKEAFAHSQ